MRAPARPFARAPRLRLSPHLRPAAGARYSRPLVGHA